MPLEQRREQLLDATIRIIVRDGYDRVTIDAIAKEVAETPELVASAPHNAPIGRVDEVTAARKPNFRWNPATDGKVTAAQVAERPGACT